MKKKYSEHTRAFLSGYAIAGFFLLPLYSMSALAAVTISKFEPALPFDDPSQSYILETISDDFLMEWSSDAEYCYLYRNMENTNRQRLPDGALYIARDFTVADPTMSLVCANGESSSPDDVDPNQSDSSTVSFILRENIEQPDEIVINEFSTTLPFDADTNTYQLQTFATDVELQWSTNANYCYLFRNDDVTTTQRAGSGDFIARRDFEISNPTMTLKCANEDSDSSESLSEEDSRSATLSFTVLEDGIPNNQINIEPDTRAVAPDAEVPMGASAGLNGLEAFYETGKQTRVINVNGIQVEYSTNVMDIGLDVDSLINREQDNNYFDVTLTQLGSGATTIAQFQFIIVGDPETGDDDITFTSQNGRLITAGADAVSLSNNLNGTWSLILTLDQQLSLPVTSDQELQESFLITGINTENLTHVKTIDSEGFIYERLRPGADLTDYYNDNLLGEIVFLSVNQTQDGATRAIIQYDGDLPVLTQLTGLYSDIALPGEVSISLNGQLVSITMAAEHPTREGVYLYAIDDGIVLNGLPQLIVISEESQQFFNLVGYESFDSITRQNTDFFGELP